MTATFLSSQAQRSATTDVDGGFLLLQLNAGTYKIVVQAPGFVSMSQDVTY